MNKVNNSKSHICQKSNICLHGIQNSGSRVQHMGEYQTAPNNLSNYVAQNYTMEKGQ